MRKEMLNCIEEDKLRKVPTLIRERWSIFAHGRHEMKQRSVQLPSMLTMKLSKTESENLPAQLNDQWSLL